MIFNSLHFLIFLPIVVAIYFMLPVRRRWILLLIASYYFYMTWKAEYAILILFSTFVDYTVALQLPKARTQKIKNWLLGISLFFNFSLLFAFKYFNFISDSVQILLSSLGVPFSKPVLDVLLPVGISFYTFQTLAYTIDVYRGKVLPEKHFGIFAVYVAYFPQLVAGPIERPGNLIPQLKQKFSFSYDKAVSGVTKILIGLVKKIVIADRLAVIVNLVYENPTQFTGLEILIATIFFAVQIYCDFSGYSDIAIGSARIIGVELMENFRQPYFARSVAEFWKRWHISLSTWFMDYLYIPLGGSRVKVSRWVFNIFVVFLVSGLWHGASWTFVFWGGLHGLYMVVPRLFALIPPWKKLMDNLSGSIVFGLVLVLWTNILVLLSWVFFRAESIREAFFILSKMLSFSKGWGDLLWTVKDSELFTAAFVIFGLFVFDIFREKRFSSSFHPAARIALGVFAVMLIIFVGVNSGTQFIYFQF